MNLKLTYFNLSQQTPFVDTIVFCQMKFVVRTLGRIFHHLSGEDCNLSILVLACFCLLLPCILTCLILISRIFAEVLLHFSEFRAASFVNFRDPYFNLYLGVFKYFYSVKFISIRLFLFMCLDSSVSQSATFVKLKSGVQIPLEAFDIF